MVDAAADDEWVENAVPWAVQKAHEIGSAVEYWVAQATAV